MPRQTPGLFHGPSAYAARTPWRPRLALPAAAALVLTHLGCVWAIAQVLDRSWAIAVSLALQIVLIVGAGTCFGGSPWEVLALRRPAAGWRAYAAALLLVPAFIAYAILLAIVVVHRRAGYSVGLPPDFPFLPPLEGAELAVWVVVLALLVPLREELLFRGFLLPALAQTRLGYWGAAVVVAGAWAVFHASLLALVPVFAIGMLFAWLLRRTGSLRVPIVCHATHNLFGVLAPVLGLPGLG